MPLLAAPEILTGLVIPLGSRLRSRHSDKDRESKRKSGEAAVHDGIIRGRKSSVEIMRLDTGLITTRIQFHPSIKIDVLTV